MKRFITTVEEGKDGKKYYNRIGEILTFNGTNGAYEKVKIYHMPGQLLSVFEDNPKNNDSQLNGFGA